MNAAFASRLGSGFHNLAAMEPLDIVIVGGCGHVGLPLALSFADAGYRVGVDDIDTAKIERVRAGEVPFKEAGAEQLLAKLLPTGRLEFGSEPAMLKRAGTVVIVIGTPIDEFMNPSVTVFDRVIDELIPHIQPHCLVVLRSTVFPGTTEGVQRRLHAAGLDADVVFCPERIAEGHALEEIRSLPQLVGASSSDAYERAARLFERLGVQIVRTTPIEAELAKLLTNTWRYMKFAIANQFFLIAHRSGVDYNRVLGAIRNDYPRAADLPGPGFAAGPCLMKDTMQLFAFQKHDFILGQVAMTINEGLPNFIVERLAAQFDLDKTPVGILGMAFKAESDDIRESLSYKLGKLLRFHGAKVFYSDEYAKDPTFVDKETLVRESDVVIVGVPHNAYRSLQVPTEKHVVDLWSILPAPKGA